MMFLASVAFDFLANAVVQDWPTNRNSGRMGSRFVLNWC